MWQLGRPRKPGWYILQYSEDDRFVVVHAFFDDGVDGDDKLVYEEMETKGYCGDYEILHSFLEIPIPLNPE